MIIRTSIHSFYEASLLDFWLVQFSRIGSSIIGSTLIDKTMPADQARAAKALLNHVFFKFSNDMTLEIYVSSSHMLMFDNTLHFDDIKAKDIRLLLYKIFVIGIVYATSGGTWSTWSDDLIKPIRDAMDSRDVFVKHGQANSSIDMPCYMFGSPMNIPMKHFVDAVLKITEDDKPGENAVDPVEATVLQTANDEIEKIKRMSCDEAAALEQEYERRMQDISDRKDRKIDEVMGMVKDIVRKKETPEDFVDPCAYAIVTHHKIWTPQTDFSI